MKNNIIKVSKRGTLYVETKDFFDDEKIIKQISDLKKSSIVKDIERRKRLN